MNTNTRISAIIILNNDGFSNLREFYHSCKETLERSCDTVEFIFVTFGQLPQSLTVLDTLAGEGTRIKVVQLSQWIGEAGAFMAGFEHARGDLILSLPPNPTVAAAELSKLTESIDQNDVVIAARRPRIDSLLNRIQTGIFHGVINLALGCRMHDLGCHLILMRRRVLEKVHVYGDQFLFLPVLAIRHGFKVTEVTVKQLKKEASQWFFPLGSYIGRVLDTISIIFMSRFTKKPLRFFGFIGLVILVIGAVLAAHLFIERMYMGVALANRPMLLLDLLLIILGIQMFAIGIIGEIIIFTHARQLKEYHVDTIVS